VHLHGVGGLGCGHEKSSGGCLLPGKAMASEVTNCTSLSGQRRDVLEGFCPTKQALDTPDRPQIQPTMQCRNFGLFRQMLAADGAFSAHLPGRRRIGRHLQLK
jgi:hypothetical protein